MTDPNLGAIPALVLAGGLGTRLRPALDRLPKVLAPVHGRPFLARILAQLAAAGTREVWLCTGHGADQVAAAFGDTYGPLRLCYAREPAPLGTGGALGRAAALCGAELVLALNGDSFCEADLAAFLDWHRRRRAAASLVCTRIPDCSRYGRVGLATDGAVRHFEEKTTRPEPGWINAGIYLIASRLLKLIPADRAVSLERDLFPAWIGDGLYGWTGGGRFLDIGTPLAYAAATAFFAPPGPAQDDGKQSP